MGWIPVLIFYTLLLLGCTLETTVIITMILTIAVWGMWLIKEI